MTRAAITTPSWAVVDVETTGLHPVRDRIVEIAVVRLDQDAMVVDEWTTLINPGKRALLTRVHGIGRDDVSRAPTFSEVLPQLLWLLSDNVIVAHNAPFDVAFLQSETVRAGTAWGPVEGFCTMAITHQLGLAKNRKLNLCVKELGIEQEPDHSALQDARAVAKILTLLESRLWTLATPPSAPHWPRPSNEIRIEPRTRPVSPPHMAAGQKELTQWRLPPGIGIAPEAATTYLGLLDRVVEDGVVTSSEVDALALFSGACGITRDIARQLHVAYLDEMWRIAKADSIVTDDERDHLAKLVGLLTQALPR